MRLLNENKKQSGFSNTSTYDLENVIAFSLLTLDVPEHLGQHPAALSPYVVTLVLKIVSCLNLN